MELKELSRRISRYRANVENLQLEKNRLLNEIDALDQEALKIKIGTACTGTSTAFVLAISLTVGCSIGQHLIVGTDIAVVI